MTKNKLEKLFSESMHSELNKNFWFMKLHNNPLAHQNTPADYILDFVDMGKLNLVLVESKQVTCDPDGTGRLALKRLKQMHDLLAFENKCPLAHHSFFLIAFYDGRWSKSDIYLIPAILINDLMQTWSKVSLNREDMRNLFQLYLINLKNGLIDGEYLIQWIALKQSTNA